MITTAQQRNVRAAITGVVHELRLTDGVAVFVTRGYWDVALSGMVVAVAPDGAVSGWELRHAWTNDGPGWQVVYAVPSHYSLTDLWVDRWLAGEGECTASVGRVRPAFVSPALHLQRTEALPRWIVAGVRRAQTDWISREAYDVPAALAAGLAAIYGPDLPTEQKVPGGRKHGV